MYVGPQSQRPQHAHQPAGCTRPTVLRSWGRGRTFAWAYRALFALLALSVLLSGGPARAQALLRCEVTQRLHAACCCPGSASATTSTVRVRASTARVAPSSCCTRVELERGLPNSALVAQTDVMPPLLVALGSPCRGFGALAFTSHTAHHAPRSLAPAPPTRAAPSLIVLHRRFLI